MIESPPMLPCPFCGSRDLRLIHIFHRAATNRFYVRCNPCGGHGPTTDGRYNAIAAWNVPSRDVVEDAEADTM